MIHATAIPSVHHGSHIWIELRGVRRACERREPESRGFVLGFIRRDLATKHPFQNFVARVWCVGTGGRGRRGTVGQAVSGHRVPKDESRAAIEIWMSPAPTSNDSIHVLIPEKAAEVFDTLNIRPSLGELINDGCL